MIDRLRKLVTGLIPSGTVTERTVKSGIWMAAIKMSGRVLQILMLIILARILAPQDFGLVGIALLSLSAVKKFTNVGLNAALIQQVDENVDDYLDTTWCLEAGRGLLITAVLFVVAPYLSILFSEPQATPLIRVIGLAPLFYGLRNPGVVYFRKNLEFHKEFAYRTSGDVIQFVVGVGYALIYPTVWALVFAFLASDVVRFMLSYVIHDYRPWPAFDWSIAKKLIDYGKWITGSSIIHFIYSEGDDAFVGWYLSATALGFYQYAYRIADMPATEVSGIIANVTFPAYSKFQENPELLRQALLGTLQTTAFIAVPLSFGIALIAPSFVPVVLGSDWTPMIVTMQLLAVYGLLHALTRNFGSLLKAIGRPDVITKLGMVRILAIAIFIWPATARWGIEGTALVVVGVFVFPMLPLDVYVVSRMTAATSTEIYRTYVFPIVAGVVMFLTLWYVRGVVSLSPLVELIVFIPAGAVLYFAAALLLDRWFDWGIKQNLQSIIGGVTG